MNQTIHHPKDLDRYYQESLESLFPEGKINAFRLLATDNQRLIQNLKQACQGTNTNGKDTQADED